MAGYVLAADIVYVTDIEIYTYLVRDLPPFLRHGHVKVLFRVGRQLTVIITGTMRN